MKYLTPRTLAFVGFLSLSACSTFTRHALAPSSAGTCRVAGASPAVTWYRPHDPDNRSRLDSFCAAVGPVLFDRGAATGTAAAPPALREIALVSWNLHV